MQAPNRCFTTDLLARGRGIEYTWRIVPGDLNQPVAKIPNVDPVTGKFRAGWTGDIATALKTLGSECKPVRVIAGTDDERGTHEGTGIAADCLHDAIALVLFWPTGLAVDFLGERPGCGPDRPHIFDVVLPFDIINGDCRRVDVAAVTSREKLGRLAHMPWNVARVVVDDVACALASSAFRPSPAFASLSPESSSTLSPNRPFLLPRSNTVTWRPRSSE